jgi:hypothetical protein
MKVTKVTKSEGSIVTYNTSGFAGGTVTVNNLLSESSWKIVTGCSANWGLIDARNNHHGVRSTRKCPDNRCPGIIQIPGERARCRNGKCKRCNKWYCMRCLSGVLHIGDHECKDSRGNYYTKDSGGISVCREAGLQTFSDIGVLTLKDDGNYGEI